jgi:hypothetical protein
MSLLQSHRDLSRYHFKDNDGTYDLLAFNELREHFKLIQLKLLKEQDDKEFEDESNLIVDHEHLLTAKFTFKGEDMSIVIAGDQNIRSEMIDFVYLKKYGSMPHYYQKTKSATQFSVLIEIHTKCGHYYAYYSYYRKATVVGHHQTQIHLQYEKNLPTLWVQLSLYDRNLLVESGVSDPDDL